jgi:DNA invertase Pin-like site-specific DNA recombinase
MSSMVFGYARVSMDRGCQKEDRQVDQLLQFGIPAENIFVDKVTGTTLERPAFQDLQQRLRPGDTVVSESLSRISRSMADLIATVEGWNARGINYRSLKEDLQFSTSTGKLLLGMLAAISQFERDIIRDRVIEGLKSARARGRKGGRPPKSPTVIQKALKLYEAGVHTVPEIVKLTGVSRALLYQKLHEKRMAEAEVPKSD